MSAARRTWVVGVGVATVVLFADMSAALLDALEDGYTYPLVSIAAIALIVGVSALCIRFSARQIAAAQYTREAVEAGEL